jgi:hypothetical protein
MLAVAFTRVKKETVRPGQCTELIRKQAQVVAGIGGNARSLKRLASQFSESTAGLESEVAFIRLLTQLKQQMEERGTPDDEREDFARFIALVAGPTLLLEGNELEEIIREAGGNPEARHFQSPVCWWLYKEILGYWNS